MYEVTYIDKKGEFITEDIDLGIQDPVLIARILDYTIDGKVIKAAEK